MHEMSLGEKIAYARSKKRMTQKQLSKLSGVSLRTINAIEHGEVNPTITTIGNIAWTLGLTIDDLWKSKI